MYKSKDRQRVEEMRNFGTALLMAVFFIAALNLLELIFMFLPLLPIAMAGVLMIVISLQVLHALGVINYDLSKLRK